MKENNNDNQMIKSIGESVLRQVKGEYDEGSKQVDAVVNVGGSLIAHAMSTVIEVYGEEAAREAFQGSIKRVEKMIFDGDKQ